ncbi:MAG: biotin--[acetyl-CoA-carboxylase] ligase [Prevotellaceae bacterium]|jgi:BirA family biotin operon repressor/biotin-[acetyl-CoA-carboxylase] ligase|nr:biotin--[acetyl-CoA-carboxylase] ligase [Prevotellaceae bacterium]
MTYSPSPVVRLQETDSTNRYLIELCSHQPPEAFTAVVTHTQTAGKGQRGNSWESEPGRNLTFSFVMYPTFVSAAQSFVLSQLVALGVKETLDEYTDDIVIKWPNDIYWREKKICGILLENVIAGSRIAQCVSGIGLNINQAAFHSDAPNPVSLAQITGREYDLDLLLSRYMDIVRRSYDALAAQPATAAAEINRRYTASLYRRTGFHRYRDDDGEFDARILRVEPKGQLVLADRAGRERSYWFKEVVFVH